MTSPAAADLRASADGAPCMGCGVIDGTCVLAHSNELEHRGIGLKAPDWMGAILCHACHDLADGRAGDLSLAEKRHFWRLAHDRTVEWWMTSGFLIRNPSWKAIRPGG